MTTRVLIVDDSDIAAEVVRRVIDAAPDMRVIGQVRSADEVIAKALHRSADVVLLDLWMPGKTGLAVIRQLSDERPVVVVSDVEHDSPLAREAVAQGARAFVSKKDLSTKAGAVRVRSVVRAAGRRGTTSVFPPVVAIVGSTGAMEPLEKLLTGLPVAEAAVLILQHMPKGREAGFARWIRSIGHDTRVVTTGDPLEIGRVAVAPAEGHLVVRGERLAITYDPPVEGHRPSASVLLSSAASLGSRLLAVVLSGMGRDGASAVPELLARGASCMAQAPDDCVVGSMPRAALEKSPRVRSVPAKDLGIHVARWIERTTRA